jgi:hypothetical protein
VDVARLLVVVHIVRIVVVTFIVQFMQQGSRRRMGELRLLWRRVMEVLVLR